MMYRTLKGYSMRLYHGLMRNKVAGRSLRTDNADLPYLMQECVTSSAPSTPSQMCKSVASSGHPHISDYCDTASNPAHFPSFDKI